MKKRFILIFLLFLSNVLAKESNIIDRKNRVFANTNDFYQMGACKPICRALKGTLESQITGFNPFTGVTNCTIIDPNLKLELKDNDTDTEELIPTGLTADTYNENCVDNTNIRVPFSSLKSYGKDIFSSLAQLPYSQNKTFSHFLTSLMTLDDDIIDFKTTNSTGKFTLKDSNSFYGTSSASTGNAKSKNIINESNLSFFSNLFVGMNKVYVHLQIFIFVFVAGYFSFTYVFSFIMAKLEQKEFEYRVLPTLFIPLLCMALFLLPIPSADTSISKTPFQSIVQYFTSKSVNLADRVATAGTEAYLKKLYGSVGAVSTNDEKYTAERIKNLTNALSYLEIAYKGCRKRYPESVTETFQIRDELLKSFELMNENKTVQDYSARGCRKIEHDILVYKRELLEQKSYLQAINNAYTSSRLQSTLTKVTNNVKATNDSLGWLSSLTIPAIKVVVDNSSTITNANSNKILEKNIKINDIDNNTNEYEKPSVMGMNFGEIAYLTLPGAGSIFRYFDDYGSPSENSTKDTHSKGGDSKGKKDGMFKKFSKMLGKFARGLSGVPIIGSAITTVVDFMRKDAIMMGIQAFYKAILHYLPITIGIGAGMVAIIIYLKELIVYFYFAPFMVAYSVTLRRKNKITDFFVTGISIFLKPLLISISIFLAIFFYTLTNDIFGTMVAQQFTSLSSLSNSEWGFINGFTLSLFEALLNILTAIFVSYLMWKIIVNGAEMMLKMVGLTTSSFEGIAHSLSQKTEGRGLQV